MKISLEPSAKLPDQSTREMSRAHMRQRWLQELEKAQLGTKKSAKERGGVANETAHFVSDCWTSSGRGCDESVLNHLNVGLAVPNSNIQVNGANEQRDPAMLGSTKSERGACVVEQPTQQAAIEASNLRKIDAGDEAHQSQKVVSLARLFLDSLPKWARDNIHITFSGEGVVVWIRRADIASSEIHPTIRELQLCLRQSGFKLSQVHLNGQLIQLHLLESCEARVY